MTEKTNATAIPVRQNKCPRTSVTALILCGALDEMTRQICYFLPSNFGFILPMPLYPDHLLSIIINTMRHNSIDDDFVSHANTFCFLNSVGIQLKFYWDIIGNRRPGYSI
jgi:hypothetical protein